MNRPLRFAVIGCGFWAKYQISAWMELEGVELVALYNRTIEQADELASLFNVPRTYDNIDLLFTQETIDFVDIITDVATHAHFTKLAAQRGIAVICQKPMAVDLAEAASMLEFCRNRRVPLYIHENFRWQTPIRKVKEILETKVIGRPFKAKISYCSAFPVLEKQPFLANLEHFILTDVGSHILDVSRFLFGEPRSVYCQTRRINPRLKGEDVANVSMHMDDNLICFVEMSYASILEHDFFPQTLITVEGDRGSMQVMPDYTIRLTTTGYSETVNAHPTPFDWVDPDYAVVQSSIVPCNKNILNGLRGIKKAETTGDDNFKTLQLVWAAYASAEENIVIDMKLKEPVSKIVKQ
jgi:predicted dehydrogenase